MCSHVDDREKEKREYKNKHRVSDDDKWASDGLEELSENIAFDVIQKANRDRRKEMANRPQPAAASKPTESKSGDPEKGQTRKKVSSSDESYESSS
jgi:hypothetical protein